MTKRPSNINGDPQIRQVASAAAVAVVASVVGTSFASSVDAVARYTAHNTFLAISGPAAVFLVTYVLTLRFFTRGRSR